MNIESEIEILLGIKQVDDLQEGVVPQYLEGRYTRMSAAEELANCVEGNILVQASLLKAMTNDDEEDVRKVALESLSQLNTEVSTIACIIGLYDADSGVRYDAIEGLRWKNLQLAKYFAEKLIKDEDEVVKDYAQGILELNEKE